MIKKDRVTKVEHVWSKGEDRWIYIEYNDQRRIIGLNFMHGDDYGCFTKYRCCSDQDLTDFYHFMLGTFPNEWKVSNTIEFINKCMWTFHTARGVWPARKN